MKMFVYVIDSDIRGIVSAVDQEEAAKEVTELPEIFQGIAWV